MMTTESGPLDLAALAELADRIGRVPLRELHCRRDVSRWLMLKLPQAEPEFPFTGAASNLTGIPVIDDPDVEDGWWELREDGEVIAAGYIEVPAWFTDLVNAPADFKLTPVTDSYRLDARFPPGVTPALISVAVLSGV